MPDLRIGQHDGIIRRLREVKSGEHCEEVVAVSGSDIVRAQHRLFLIGSGQISLAVAGNVRGTFANPVGSGVRLIVARLSVYGSAQSFSKLFIDPTVGLPASAARPVHNFVFGSPVASPAVLKVDTDATTPLSGGTDTGVTIGTGGGRRVEIEAPFVLSPGHVLGVAIPFAGAADVTFNLIYTQETI